MNIFVTNTISSKQYHEIMELVEFCSKADGTHGVSFVEQELNEIEEFPCFYLMYDGSKLISYLSVFIPSEKQCEIYGATLPEERFKGYFKKLLSEALKNIRKYDINERLVAMEPGCKEMEEYLQKLGSKIIDTDYLMVYDMEKTPNPQNILRLKNDKIDNTEYYETYKDNELIGSCKVEYTRSHAVIYDFYVEETCRGKGYGTETLLLILEHILSNDASKILLHVNGANVAAHAMYSHHGFVSEEQIDYWHLN